jgi:hypothetical protein
MEQILYIRYGEEGLISAKGSYKFILQVKKSLMKFLMFLLKNQPVNMQMLNLSKTKVLFLGVFCWIVIVKSKKKDSRNRVQYYSKVKLALPILKIRQKLANLGFLKEYMPGKRLVPNSISK